MTSGETTEGEEDRKGLLRRFVGTLLSPAETLARVTVQPRWLSMLALTTSVSVICAGGLLSTEIGQQAWLDQTVTQMETLGRDVSDAQYERLEQMARFAPYLAGGQLLVSLPLLTATVAGILFAVFSVGLGGDATYGQVLAIVSHAGVVTTVRQVLITPLAYARESLSSPTSLSVFLPMLDEGSLLARLCGMVDFFAVWWTLVLAIGLSRLYRKPTRRIAVGLFAVYGVIAVAVAVVLTWIGAS